MQFAWFLVVLFAVPALSDDSTDPLMSAAGNGKVEEVQKLLASGANPNSKNEWGETVLHVAGIAANVDIIKALLNAGANVDAATAGEYKGHTTIVRRTPLMWMVYSPPKKAFPTVKLLVEAGARLDITNEEGKTVVDLVRDMKAASADVGTMLEYLEAHEAKQAKASQGEL